MKAGYLVAATLFRVEYHGVQLVVKKQTGLYRKAVPKYFYDEFVKVATAAARLETKAYGETVKVVSWPY